MDSNPPDETAQPSDAYGRPHLRDLSDEELWRKFDSGELGLGDMSDEAAARMFEWEAADSEVDEDLIPQIDPPRRAATEFDRQVDAVLEGISIVEAYRRWNVKGFTPKPGNKRESIMVRCPNPKHPDNNPSAWLNADKGLWTCGGCGFAGGDLYDLAAWHYGYDVPGYKTNGDFPKLRRDIASEFGVQETKTLGGSSVTLPELVGGDLEHADIAADNPDASEERPDNAVIGGCFTGGASKEPTSEPQVASVTTMPGVSDPPMVPELDSFIDWESLVTEDDFLGQWMEAVTIDDFPHEYRFWMGLQALGFAAGNTLMLDDNPPVKGSLFLCLFGSTGTNKSRSTYVYRELVEKVFRFDPGDEYTGPSGVEMIPEPGSGEALIDSFCHPLQDPSTNKIIDHAPVSGLVRVEEFSSFVGKANRAGSSLKPVLIDLYDATMRDVTMKSRGAGTSIARSPFCQAITTTQPEAIHAFLDRVDSQSGFLNRWLFIMGERRRDKINYMPSSPDINVPIETLKAVRKWVNTHPGRMRLSGDPLTLWNHFCSTEMNPLIKKEPNPILNRVELTLKKLMLLFAVNEQRAHPSVHDVERAISFFPYLLTTYGAVTRSLMQTDHDECADDLIAAIHAHVERGQMPTMRNLNHSIRTRHDRFVVERTVKNMIATGQIIERIYTPTKGPKTPIYLDIEAEEKLDIRSDGRLRSPKK